MNNPKNTSSTLPYEIESQKKNNITKSSGEAIIKIKDETITLKEGTIIIETTSGPVKIANIGKHIYINADTLPNEFFITSDLPIDVVLDKVNSGVIAGKDVSIAGHAVTIVAGENVSIADHPTTITAGNISLIEDTVNHVDAANLLENVPGLIGTPPQSDFQQ